MCFKEFKLGEGHAICDNLLDGFWIFLSAGDGASKILTKCAKSL